MFIRNTTTRQKRPRASFYPDFVVEKFTDIDFQYLRSLGIRAVLVDLDGTVVSRGTFEVSPAVTRLLETADMEVYVATNRRQGRGLQTLITDLRANGSVHPQGVWGKPSKKYYQQALHATGYESWRTLMIGDRFIQDVLGANRAGVYSLAVMKWDEPRNWFDSVLSRIERLFTRRIIRKYATRHDGSA